MQNTLSPQNTLSYRKTKAGEWVVFGPMQAFRGTPQWVTVSKKDGAVKKEFVKKLGRPFVVNGTEMVYGYIDRSARCYDDQGRPLTRRNNEDLDYDCQTKFGHF